MTVVGVDPGVSGALVAVNGGLVWDWIDMPTIDVARGVKKRKVVDGYGVRDWLVKVGQVDLVAIEQVGGVTGQSAMTSFQFGLGTGVIHGILVALERPWQLVTPQAWQKVAGVGADKGQHRQRAQQQFPQAADLFSRVKDDGRADAALIAWWARSRG